MFLVAVSEAFAYRILPENYRGMLALLRYDDGTEKCVGRDLCEAACPSRVIAVMNAEVPAQPTKRYAIEPSAQSLLVFRKEA